MVFDFLTSSFLPIPNFLIAALFATSSYGIQLTQIRGCIGGMAHPLLLGRSKSGFFSG